MEIALTGLALATVISLLGWLLRRSINEIDGRVAALEKSEQDTAVKLAEHNSKVEMLSLSDADLKIEIKYIRDHMVRREDLTALSQRIDDALQIKRRR